MLSYANFPLFNRDLFLKIWSLFIADAFQFPARCSFSGSSFIPIKIIIDPSDFLSILVFFLVSTKFLCQTYSLPFIPAAFNAVLLPGTNHDKIVFPILPNESLNESVTGFPWMPGSSNKKPPNGHQETFPKERTGLFCKSFDFTCILHTTPAPAASGRTRSNDPGLCVPSLRRWNR